MNNLFSIHHINNNSHHEIIWFPEKWYQYVPTAKMQTMKKPVLDGKY
jgi:hypothetical protein